MVNACRRSNWYFKRKKRRENCFRKCTHAFTPNYRTEHAFGLLKYWKIKQKKKTENRKIHKRQKGVRCRQRLWWKSHAPSVHCFVECQNRKHVQSESEIRSRTKRNYVVWNYIKAYIEWTEKTWTKIREATSQIIMQNGSEAHRKTKKRNL